MLSSVTKIDNSFVEGIVLEVDEVYAFCKVRTTQGQILNDVQWLSLVGTGSTQGGVYSVPQLEERVLISYHLGYPIILGSLPRIEAESSSGASIDESGDYQPPAGSLAPANSAVVSTPGTPAAYLPGDKAMVSEGGAVVAVLGGGSVLLKATPLAQIFLTRLGNYGRIVASNFEVHTDLHSDVVSNHEGRAYRYIAYGTDRNGAQAGKYTYTEIHGDTAAGEALGADYGNSNTTLPAANTTLVKRAIFKPDSEDEGKLKPVMSETLSDVGHTAKTNKTIDGTKTSTVNQEVDNFKVTLDVDGAASSMHVEKQKVTINTNLGGNDSTVKLEDAKITISTAGFGTVDMVIENGKVDLKTSGRTFLFDKDGLHIS